MLCVQIQKLRVLFSDCSNRLKVPLSLGAHGFVPPKPQASIGRSEQHQCCFCPLCCSNVTRREGQNEITSAWNGCQDIALVPSRKIHYNVVISFAFKTQLQMMFLFAWLMLFCSVCFVKLVSVVRESSAVFLILLP